MVIGEGDGVGMGVAVVDGVGDGIGDGVGIGDGRAVGIAVGCAVGFGCNVGRGVAFWLIGLTIFVRIWAEGMMINTMLRMSTAMIVHEIPTNNTRFFVTGNLLPVLFLLP